MNKDYNIEESSIRRAKNAKVRRKKRAQRRAISVCLLCLIVVFAINKAMPDLFPTLSNKVILGIRGEEQEKKVPTPPSPQKAVLSAEFLPDQLYSPYALLLDLYDSSILLDKNGTAKVSPASLTKIMTALVAIEHLPDLNQVLTVPDSIFPYLYTSHASVAGFSPNEQLPAIDVLYGCALPSGADASLTLAVTIAGSEADFVALMNDKAAQLGLTDSHFANVSGLYDPQHYSTAKDMAILFQNALQNKTFCQIFSAKQYTTSTTSYHPDGITFNSTMFGRMSSPYFADGEILGGKTGYISDAGLCLASFAVRKDREFVLITLGAQGSPYQDPLHLWDAFKVYDSLRDEPAGATDSAIDKQ